MELNKLAQEIHENSKAHGWWDKERSFDEIIALCHSELSEALEEYRNGRPMAYFNGEKPEGVEVELADTVIRVLDWCAKEGIDIDDERSESGCTISDCVDAVREYALPKLIAECHYMLSLAYEGDLMRAFFLATCIDLIEVWVNANGGDLWRTLDAKHEYNKTRPYRHGGKVV